MIYDSVVFFNAPATTEIYTLSLHDALPIFGQRPRRRRGHRRAAGDAGRPALGREPPGPRLRGRLLGDRPQRGRGPDRKSTRLNSSHANISYAVFCLKKKNILWSYS